MTVLPKILKILFVSHSSDFEGAEQSLLGILENLDRNRFDPLVVLPSDQGDLHKRLIDLQIPVRVIPLNWWIREEKLPRFTRTLLSNLRCARNIARVIAQCKIDIVYTNSAVTLVGALAAAMSRRPHVWHVREILKNHPLKSCLPLSLTFRVIAALSRKIVVNSAAVAQQFPPTIRKKRVVVVHNAINPAMYCQDVSTVATRRELSLPADTQLIGVIGKVQGHKNHEAAIQAFALVLQKCPRARLLIAGREDRPYKKILEEQILSLGLSDKIYFMGFRSDIPSLLHQLDVLVMASHAEAFGRIMIEAMAAAKPVVAFDTGASPEIIVHGQTGILVPYPDIAAMADAMVAILKNPERAGAMGQAGAKRAVAHFHIQQHAEKIQDVLEGLVCAGYR